MSYNSSCACNHTHTVFSKPLDIHFTQCLQKDNYLSEFVTEIDKAKVRENLGISDEYTMTWENIQGFVESNEQIMGLFNRLNDQYNELRRLISNTDSGETIIDSEELNSLKALVQKNSDDISNIKVQLQGLQFQITELQNRPDNDTVYNDSQIRSLITNLTNRVSALEQGSDVPDTTIKQYIGYADDYNKIIGKSQFETNSVKGVWNSSNLKTSGNFPGLGLWIVTTENITSITQNNFAYTLQNITESYNNQIYKIYVIGPVNDNSGEFTIQ